MHERSSSRRLRFVRGLEPVDLPSPRAEEETAASILPGAPRVGPLDALLREVDDLRLTLETDLTLAAAAVEAGGTKTALEIIAADQESLRAFEDTALGHLEELSVAAKSAEPSRWSRMARLPAAPFVAAAAVVGLLIGVVPSIGGAGGSRSEFSSVSAQSSLEQLTHLTSQGAHPEELREVALTLHDQIAALVDGSISPATAQQALHLLSLERSVIVRSGDGAALQDVLIESAALAAKIRSALPASLRSNVPRAPVIPLLSPSPSRPRETSRPRASSSPTPAPKPSATASPKPTPKPTPTATTKPTPSPTAGPSTTPSHSTPFLPGGDADGDSGNDGVPADGH